MDWSNCVENGVATLRCIPVAINGVVNASMILAAIVAIFFIILSGIKLLISGGDEIQVGKAKKSLTYAIVGLVIISLAFVIVNFIGTRLNFKAI